MNASPQMIGNSHAQYLCSSLVADDSGCSRINHVDTAIEIALKYYVSGKEGSDEYRRL